MLKTPIREALDVVLTRKKGTSSEFAHALRKNINIACNRLNALQKMGLVCRVRDGSVSGGGRQFFLRINCVKLSAVNYQLLASLHPPKAIDGLTAWGRGFGRARGAPPLRFYPRILPLTADR